MGELYEERDGLNAIWEREKKHADQIQETKEQLENLRTEAEREERNGNYGRVAEIRYGLMQDLEANLEKSRKSLKKRIVP